MKNKKEISNSFSEEGIRYIQCTSCGTYVENVSTRAISAVCSRCTIVRTINLWNPFIKKKKSRGANKPKGWHWMKEFVDKDGNVFHKGKEVPELKGTLSPTEIKSVVRKKKKKKKKKESYEKKITLLAKEYKEKKKLQKENKLGTKK